MQKLTPLNHTCKEALIRRRAWLRSKRYRQRLLGERMVALVEQIATANLPEAEARQLYRSLLHEAERLAVIGPWTDELIEETEITIGLIEDHHQELPSFAISDRDRIRRCRGFMGQAEPPPSERRRPLGRNERPRAALTGDVVLPATPSKISKFRPRTSGKRREHRLRARPLTSGQGK